MMRGAGPVGHALRLGAAISVLSVALTAAFYLSGFVYRRFDLHPHPLAALILNVVLAVTLLFVAVHTIGIWFHPRRHRDLFVSVMSALDRIAAGDFSVRLDDVYGDRGPFAELVRSVNQTAAKLDELDRMRREFVSDVSHEIQSPLTSIRGFASALRQNHLAEEERRHYLEIIEAESLRLSRLSANLLKLASLESNQAQLSPSAFRLDRQIRDLILACETQWTAKRLDVGAELDEVEIVADADLLSQVWTNLLHNAIKFTPEGGSIRVTLRRAGDRVEAAVADTGIGVSPEDQPRIFERFYKADRSRQRSVEGSGLGLAIARRVAEMHGGAISVASRPGGGAEFRVSLPFKFR